MVKLYNNSSIYRLLFLALLSAPPNGLLGRQADDIPILNGDKGVTHSSAAQLSPGTAEGLTATITSLTTSWNGSSWTGGLPNSTLHASILANYSGPGFDCLDLSCASGTQFAPTGEVRVAGNADIQAAVVSGKVHLVGATGSQTVKGSFFDLTLENPSGISVAGDARIAGTLKLISGLFQTNNSLTLVSNATRTARVAKIETGASIFGNVMVQRFVPGGQKSWRFIGTPVANQTQASWSDDFQIINNSMFLYNEAGNLNQDDQINGWEYLPGNPNASLQVGKGYRTYLNQAFFTNGATFDNNGPLFTGNLDFGVTYSTTGYGGGGWNLIANPYACEIDWHALSKTAIGGQVHFWNASQYASYTQGTGIGVNGAGRYIAGNQAFFVRAMAPTSQLLISEDAKPEVPQWPGLLRTNVTDPPDLARFYLKGPGNEADEAAIRWMPQTTENFDEFYDADKLPNEGLSLYTVCADGRRTSIQARPFVDGTEVTMGYSVKMEGNYTLRIKMGPEVMSGRMWYLKDNEMGSIYSLPEDYVHSFAVSGGVLESAWRFSLLGVNNPVEVQKLIDQETIILYPNPAHAQLQIQHSSDVKELALLGVDGKVIEVFAPMPDGKIVIQTKNLKSGIYALRVVSDRQVQTKKFVID